MPSKGISPNLIRLQIKHLSHNKINLINYIFTLAYHTTDHPHLSLARASVLLCFMDCSSCSVFIASSIFVQLPALPQRVKLGGFGVQRVDRRRLVVIGSSLNTPLEPRSRAGRYLGGVLLESDGKVFDAAVVKELRRLSDDREAALARRVASEGSDEAIIHRRIAELKDRENEIEVEDIIYMSILRKFSEIGVHLIPRLSRCVYNGRLEISPSKDWELESIYSYDVLELIREHVSSFIGLKANSSVSDSWVITQVQQAQLSQMYAASVLYGYFIKSASLRHRFEQSLALSNQGVTLRQNGSFPFPECLPLSLKNVVQGNTCQIGYKPPSELSYLQGDQQEKLRCYVMGFDPEMLQRYTRLKCKESADLVNKHSLALFGNLVSENSISTSFASLKRFVLEAAAFGYFLWDAEELVNSVYNLKESTTNLEN